MLKNSASDIGKLRLMDKVEMMQVESSLNLDLGLSLPPLQPVRFLLVGDSPTN